jgi:hypothetical protein
MRKDIPCKSSMKAAWLAKLIDSKQNYSEETKKVIHIDQGNNLSGRDNNYKHICTNVCTANFIKQTTGHKSLDIVQHSNSEQLQNTTLTIQTKQSTKKLQK